MRSGKASLWTTDCFAASSSQWSLTFEVRKSSYTFPSTCTWVALSQWSLTFEVRKSVSCQGIAPVPDRSQWSLTFEVRKSRRAIKENRQAFAVAMEPDL